MSGEPNGGLVSVDRALRILELLGDHRGLRVMDVAEHLGVARSTAHRLLQALVYRQFVTQDANKLYHRGPVFLASGLGSGRIPILRAAVRPHLERLSDAFEETTHLAVLEGNGARFIDGVESPQILRVGLRTGMLLPAHTTAAGKALLAELSEAEFFALYPRGLPDNPTQVTKRASLRGELMTMRKRGFTTNFEESARGVTAVAIAVRNADGVAVASVAVACPSSRCPRATVEAIAARLSEAGAAIEETLAHLELTDSASRNPEPRR